MSLVMGDVFIEIYEVRKYDTQKKGSNSTREGREEGTLREDRFSRR